MTRFHAGHTAFLALGFAIACDSESRSPEATAPSSVSTIAAQRNSAPESGTSGRRYIALLDDCDPRDPAWAPTGGCLLRRGVVSFAEFAAEANSPLSASVVGHQAWRNEPSYVRIEPDKSTRITNEGGRIHTFTRVAAFGGGKVPFLNTGLAPAPECAGSVDVPPGGSAHISGLESGNHRFMCCYHPWMRAIIKVDEDHRGHDGQ